MRKLIIYPATKPKHFNQRHLIRLRFPLVGDNFQEFIEGDREASVVTGHTTNQLCGLASKSFMQN